MTGFPVSWNEMGVLALLGGSLWASRVDATAVARRRAVIVAAFAFAATGASWIEGARSGVPDEAFRGMAALGLHGLFAADALNAPLIPLVSLVSLVTILVTLRSKIHRFSFSRILLLEALLLVTLSAENPWVLILFLAATDLPLAGELRGQGRSARVLATHLGAASLLLAGGWLTVSLSGPAASGWTAAGYGMIAAGVGIRSGLVPVHCWVLDLFENASLGTALIAMSPLAGAYAAARLLLPGAPDAVLSTLAGVALATALYGAAMSVVQSNARRFFCYFFLSHTSLVLAGLMLMSPLAVTASLVLWISAPLSLAGFGLTLRALEARTGRLSLNAFQGLHVQTPTLAALFLVTGLAAVGFPGTLGFFGVEMLTDAAARTSKPLAVGVVLAGALSGIAAVRAYGRLFLGARHRATVSLRIRRTERVAFLALVALLLGGTLWSQAQIVSRNRAADEILHLREWNATPFGAVDTEMGRP
jgi:NADH-quinone oxidoreductase subunit M